MKYLLFALLVLVGCEKQGSPEKKVTTGYVYCESSGGPIRFSSIKIEGYGHGNWIEFVSEEGQKITTSFPCAIVWDKE